MSFCNGCLKENIDGFCSACETNLFDRSKVPAQLNFNWHEIQDRIMGMPSGFSISGVQPKGFIGRDKKNLLVPNRNTESMYIIKPFLDSRRMLYLDSPANEHLTMTMAHVLFKINTAKCAFVKFANGEPAYLTRRFDRDKKGQPLRQEDFVSVMNASPEKNDHGVYKYNSFTYEEVGAKLMLADKVKFIRILIYNFLSGNGDVHLKNLSLLETSDGDMILSPSYDLMNTKLHINDPQIAMNLFVEKERTHDLLKTKFDYKISHFKELGKRLGINERILKTVDDDFRDSKNEMGKLTDRSFLSDAGKIKYKEVVELQYKNLFN